MNTDKLGYSRVLTKDPLFNPIEELYSPFHTLLKNIFVNSVPPQTIRSGQMISYLSVVDGYLKSGNYQSGVNGWKIDASGNAEFNTAVIRGSIYANSGLIGGWVVDDDGLYYNGVGSPNIRTAAAVGYGADGVIIDSDGVRGYSAILGNVFNLPSDGSAPTFSSGIIEETIFEINTNAVLRTSETVGDGTSASAGVLINNDGFFACESDQMLGDANVRISRDGSAYFKGTVNASSIVSSAIYGGTIDAPIITGGFIRTASSGQRTEINAQGIVLLGDESAATYGDATYKYGDSDRAYGTGVLAYINNVQRVVPFYVNAEQSVADMHMVNRNNDPIGPAEIGDLCVVNGRLKICTVSGTPGGWEAVGSQAEISSFSSSLSPSISPSLSKSLSPSISPSPSV